MAAVRLGKRRINVPGTPIVRIVIGVLLIVFGILGFLPFFGFWMLPLGVVVLSVDLHPVAGSGAASRSGGAAAGSANGPNGARRGSGN